MAYQVQKSFLGPGKFFEVNEIVDAKNWRNLKALIGLRYIVVVPDETDSDTKVNKTSSKKSSKIDTTV